MVASRFEFSTAGRIIFGVGSRAELPALVEPWGERYALVRGASRARAEQVLKLFGKGPRLELQVVQEPTVELVCSSVEAVRRAGVDWILAIGGGSVIDAGKAIAALATNGADPFEYLEVVGKGRALEQPALPCVAMPTTAGTGAEVTRNSVLTVKRERIKVSLRHHFLLPRLAIVDPELTLDLPPLQTAASGLDALSQLIEAYLSNRANPLTDAICADAIPKAVQALPEVYQAGTDISLRVQMAYCALCSGMVLANAGLGAVHGLAGPLGGWLDAPHGMICGRLLPAVLLMNYKAIWAGAGDLETLSRLERVAFWITGRPNSSIEEAAEQLEQWLEIFGIPRLRELGLRESDMPSVVAKAIRASSMKANPAALSSEDLMWIVRRAW